MTTPTTRRYPRSTREAFEQPLRRNPPLAPRFSTGTAAFREPLADRIIRLVRRFIVS